MGKIVFTLILLLVLATQAFAQDSINPASYDCYIDCSLGCGTSCAGGESCTYACVRNCAENCGLYPIDGEGITIGDQCEGTTAPDGHPTFLYAGSCVDVYYWEDYCSGAASCNQCNNLPAYSCIWDSGACVPCKGSSCIKSCGGSGGGAQDNGGTPDEWWEEDGGEEGSIQIQIGPDGALIYPGNQACLTYTNCQDCTDAAQTSATLAGCEWFPDSGTCIDMTGGIDTSENCAYGGEEGYDAPDLDPRINEQEPPGTNGEGTARPYRGSDGVCPVLGLIILLVGVSFYRDQNVEKVGPSPKLKGKRPTG